MTLRALPTAALALCLALPAPSRAIGATCADRPGHGKPLRLDIVAPAEGAAVRGTVEVRVEASARRMRQVDLLLDGALLATLAPPFAYAWDTSAVAAGPHVLVARWQKGKRLVESAPRAVVVEGAPPPSFRWEALGGGPVRTPAAPDGGMVPTVAVDGTGAVLLGWARPADPLDRSGPWETAAARWDGAAWGDLPRLDAVDPQDPTAATPGAPMLGLDASGAPFAFWQARLITGETVFRSARWDGAAWAPAGGPSPVDPFTSIGFALSAGPGTPVAAWTELGFAVADELTRAALWNGSAWTTLGTPPPLISARPAVDGAGQLWLAGFPQTVLRWDGATWVVDGQFTFANDLALTARGPDVAVAYLYPIPCPDGSSCVEIRVERRTSTGWARVGGSASGSLVLPGAADLTLRLDSAGSPVVAWRTDSAVHASRWNGAAWVQLGEALTGPFVQGASLALDGSDTPVIASDVVDLAAGRLDTWVVRLAR